MPAVEKSTGCTCSLSPVLSSRGSQRLHLNFADAHVETHISRGASFKNGIIPGAEEHVSGAETHSCCPSRRQRCVLTFAGVEMLIHCLIANETPAFVSAFRQKELWYSFTPALEGVWRNEICMKFPGAGMDEVSGQRLGENVCHNVMLKSG